MTFDAHAHVIVPEITGDDAWRPKVWRDDAGNQVVEMGGKQIRAAVQEFVGSAISGLTALRTGRMPSMVRYVPVRAAGALPTAAPIPEPMTASLTVCETSTSSGPASALIRAPM